VVVEEGRDGSKFVEKITDLWWDIALVKLAVRIGSKSTFQPFHPPFKALISHST
jgi:hypothetical protein